MSAGTLDHDAELKLPDYEAGGEPSFGELFAEYGILTDERQRPQQELTFFGADEEPKTNEPSFGELLAEHGIGLDVQTNLPAKKLRPASPGAERKLSLDRHQLGNIVTIAAGVSLSFLLAAADFSIKQEDQAPQAERVETSLPVASGEEPEVVSAHDTSQPEVTSPAESITPTTVEVIPPFRPQIGGIAFTATFETLCDLKVEFITADERDESVVDTLVPDHSPNMDDCEELEERERLYEARTGLDHITRAERTVTAWGPNPAPNGHANYWKPLGAYTMQADGDYISGIPGESNTAVAAVHASIDSAPGGNNALLLPGDPVTIERGDGRIFDNYQVIESYPIVDRNSIEDFQLLSNYRHTDYHSIIAIYNCSDEQGNSGQEATHRFVVFVGIPKNK